jgi:fluoride ion exporter CrcB/FEX
MFLSLIGATIRYIVDRIFNRNPKRKPWSSYWEYQDMPEKEFSDKIVGTFVIGILIYVLILLIERFS